MADLPRCIHGNHFRDYSGEWLHPACGCKFPKDWSERPVEINSLFLTLTEHRLNLAETALRHQQIEWDGERYSFIPDGIEAEFPSAQECKAASGMVIEIGRLKQQKEWANEFKLYRPDPDMKYGCVYCNENLRLRDADAVIDCYKNVCHYKCLLTAIN